MLWKNVFVLRVAYKLKTGNKRGTSQSVGIGSNCRNSAISTGATYSTLCTSGDTGGSSVAALVQGREAAVIPVAASSSRARWSCVFERGEGVDGGLGRNVVRAV